MKKQVIIISILLLVFHWAKAQQNTADPIKNLDLKLMAKFNGTWEWKTDKESLNLILKREKFTTSPTGSVIYFVYGWYRFIRNEKTISDGLDNVSKSYKPEIIGFSKKGDSSLRINFNDKTRGNVLRHGTLSFVNSSQTSVLLKIDKETGPQEHFIFEPVEHPIDTIPSTFKITLKKIQ